jgi:hypothetical protein
MTVVLAINQRGFLDQLQADVEPVEADVRNAAMLAFGANMNSQGPTGARIDNGTKIATAVSGAATLNKQSGQITSESLTTAAGVDYTLTLTDSSILATDLLMASVQLGTSTTGEPAITSVTPAAGSAVIKVRNIHATQAFNGTIIISFVDYRI